MDKKLIPQKQGGADDYQTPKIAINCLLPYLPKSCIIWEPVAGKLNLVNAFREKGYTVISSDKEFDFLTNFKECDVIITNPPFSLKYEFLNRCFVLNKPFALLVPLTILEGKKRGALLRGKHIQLIIPNKRFNFETPDGKTSGSWFQTMWLTYGLNLRYDINFVDI
jgi:hypothetical protein